MSSIRIVVDDVTKMKVDCVVNAANSGLWEGGGVCGAIFAAAGSAELTRACSAIGHCPTGSAVITPGFRLPAKYIIHAVGPRWSGGHSGEPEQLYNCYRRALELMLENGCSTIAFPLISSGIFGYPKEQAWERALRACNDFLRENADREVTVYIAVLENSAKKLGESVLAEIEK